MVRGPQSYRSGGGLEQKFSESSLTISPSEWEPEKVIRQKLFNKKYCNHPYIVAPDYDEKIMMLSSLILVNV